MIDIAIFIVFLALNFVIGFRHRGKTQSFREYAIGNKSFSTATLTATIVATWASGGALFYTLEQTYSSGLYYILAIAIGVPLGLLITGHILGSRMGEFLNNLSMAEAMGSLYGKSIQAIAAISSVLATIGYIAIQFKVISKVLSILFNYNGPEITIVAASIIIFYSALGGVKAVTFTDVIQFFTFGTLLPVLALAIWQNIQDPSKVVHTLSFNPNFNLKQTIGWNPAFMGTLSLLSYYMLPSLPPELFQRMAMARDIKQVKYALTYAAGILALIVLFMVWIGILLLSDNPSLNPDQVVRYMVDKHTYPGLRGFLGVGVIALAMSTADSALNSCAVLMANDILPSLRKAKEGSVTTAKLATFVLGFLSLLLALSIQNLLQLLLLSANFYIPILTVPMLLTIFGFRTSKRAMLVGIGAGFVTTAFLLLYFKNVNSFFPGMVANFTFLLGTHYLLREPGGWRKQEKEEDLLAESQPIYQRAWEGLSTAIKHIKPMAYLEKNLPQKDYFYPLFGFYLLTATYTSLYNIPEAVEQAYLVAYRIIQYSVLVITTGLLAYPIWPQPLKNRRLLALLWPSLIFYTLFLVGGMLVIMSELQTAPVLIFMLNLVMTALLLYWPLALSLALGGLIVAMLLFRWTMGVDVLSSISSTITFKISYGLLLFSSFLIALFRHKQARAQLEASHQLLKKMNQETNSRLLKALQSREEFLQELKPDEIALFDSTAAGYIQQVIYRVRDYLRLEVGQVNLHQLMEEVIDTLKLQELESMPKLVKKTRHQVLQVDADKIKQLLINSIHYVNSHQKHAQPLVVGLENALLGYEVSYIKDYIKKIYALKITVTTDTQPPPTKELYKVMLDQPVVHLAQSEEDLGLVENARIMDAHYGYLETVPVETGCTQVYVIPVNVREVRGKVMELLREPAAEDPAELGHPLAIQLEKELLDKLQGTGVDLEVIHKALKTIKRYHGGVRRKSGEPFFTHPMAVALILLEYSTDQDAVVAALLHDTVEDTSLTLAQLEAMFGATVAFLVRKATNLEDRIKRLNLADHENIQRLTHYEDARVALVKLSDRLHNMRTIQGHPSIAKQQLIANETISFFVPMAKNLGLEAMTQELEKLSLAVLANKP